MATSRVLICTFKNVVIFDPPIVHYQYNSDYIYHFTVLLLLFYSAGVGRSGVYIVIDFMLNRIEGKKSINISNFVNNMRRNRSKMIQTLVSLYISICFYFMFIFFYELL